MAYSVINKTGCCERNGNLQIRFDFYLEKDDPRYSDCLVDVPISEYDGKVDEDGNPIKEEYDAWLAKVEKVKQLTPFHSHFAYFDPDVTDDEIKKEMDYHLPNFYKAYQDGWNKVAGGMRHGFAIEKRIRLVNYAKTMKIAKYNILKARVENRLSTLTDIQSKPISIDDGKYYPATEIDVGSAAIDRDAIGYTNTFTFILKDNPANDTGTLDTVEVWAYTDLTGLKVGTFSGSGTSYNDRDYETIGSVTSGAKRTFTGLSIDVVTGDFLGMYVSGGRMERSSSGYSGYGYKEGDQFGSGSQTYTVISDTTLSLYATGETAVVTTHPLLLMGVGD